jgi:hypothetical protein
VTAKPKYACSYCGRRLPVEQMVRSAFTGARFCGVDLFRCEARGRKLARARIRAAKKAQLAEVS